MALPLEAQSPADLGVASVQETESSLLALVKKHITGGKVKQIEAGLKALINDAAFKALPAEAKSQVMNVLVQERIQQIAPKALTYSVVKQAIAAAQVKASVSPAAATPPSAQAPIISAPTSPVFTPASPTAKAPIAAIPVETPSKSAPAPRAEAPSVGTSPDAIGSRRQIGAPKPGQGVENVVVAPTLTEINLSIPPTNPVDAVKGSDSFREEIGAIKATITPPSASAPPYTPTVLTFNEDPTLKSERELIQSPTPLSSDKSKDKNKDNNDIVAEMSTANEKVGGLHLFIMSKIELNKKIIEDPNSSLENLIDANGYLSSLHGAVHGMDKRLMRASSKENPLHDTHGDQQWVDIYQNGLNKMSYKSTAINNFRFELPGIKQLLNQAADRIAKKAESSAQKNEIAVSTLFDHAISDVKNLNSSSDPTLNALADLYSGVKTKITPSSAPDDLSNEISRLSTPSLETTSLDTASHTILMEQRDQLVRALMAQKAYIESYNKATSWLKNPTPTHSAPLTLTKKTLAATIDRDVFPQITSELKGEANWINATLEEKKSLELTRLLGKLKQKPIQESLCGGSCSSELTKAFGKEIASIQSRENAYQKVGDLLRDAALRTSVPPAEKEKALGEQLKALAKTADTGEAKKVFESIISKNEKHLFFGHNEVAYDKDKYQKVGNHEAALGAATPTLIYAEVKSEITTKAQEADGISLMSYVNSLNKGYKNDLRNKKSLTDEERLTLYKNVAELKKALFEVNNDLSTIPNRLKENPAGFSNPLLDLLTTIKTETSVKWPGGGTSPIVTTDVILNDLKEKQTKKSTEAVRQHRWHVEDVQKRLFDHITVLEAHHTGDLTRLKALQEIRQAHTAAHETLKKYADPSGYAIHHNLAIEELKKHIMKLNNLPHINDHSIIPHDHLKQQLMDHHTHVLKALEAHAGHLDHHLNTHIPKS